MIERLVRLLFWPFRKVFQLLRFSARESSRTSRATAKSGGSLAAKSAAVQLLEAEYQDEQPGGVETLLFTQLPRPRLTERAASELSLEQATTYAEEAKQFYQKSFPLFTRSDFFYEEVEEQYINQALGYAEGSIDKRFLDVTSLFRKMLNGNTRRMLAYWMPFVFLLTFAPAVYLAITPNPVGLLGAIKEGVSLTSLFAAAAATGFALVFLVFSWPFKVVQQRNLLNLDNYITSKFARINNNFQVAKRRALNVERNKRMNERESLKDEAGAWTLSYHWFAMRLYLCELALRNKFYQLRRNTTLYWLGGLGLTAVFAVALLAAIIMTTGVSETAYETLAIYAASAGAYFVLVGAVLRRTTGMMFRVLQANEWSRFHLADLDMTIRDHVGEDKLQIVTFRDRNRME